MYKDIGVEIVEVPDSIPYVTGDSDEAVDVYLSGLKEGQVYKCGSFLHAADWESFVKEHSFDEIFYIDANVPFDCKMNSFYVERDKKREDSLFKLFNIDSDYIFIHDKPECPIKIKNDKGYRIIRPNITSETLFDYCSIIEQAKEIHCIDSSFLSMADLMQLNKSERYLHTVKTPAIPPRLRQSWRVI